MLRVSRPQLLRKLQDSNLLVSRDTARGTYHLRRTCEGVQRRVLHLSADLLRDITGGQSAVLHTG